MRTILCYGDSNTWGYDPVTQARFPQLARWTGILQAELGADYRVVEEGLPSRTTVWDDPIQEHRNGKTYLAPCLESHMPLDAVTIMLGTNDLKSRFDLHPADIADGAGVLVEIAQRGIWGHAGRAPRVLLIAPPLVGPLSAYAGFLVGAEEKSRQFAAQYRQFAEWRGCAFLDSAEVITCSERDGVHFEAGEHQKLGRAVAAAIRDMLA